MAEILNYFTEVSAEKSIREIHEALRKIGASAVMTEYDTDGLPESLAFRVKTGNGPISFRLPANIDPIYVMLQNTKSRNARPKHRSREHATRVAWRILKDWTEAQLAIIASEQVTMVQAFLPYAQDATTGETVYDRFAKEQFLALTHGSNHATPLHHDKDR